MTGPMTERVDRDSRPAASHNTHSSATRKNIKSIIQTLNDPAYDRPESANPAKLEANR